MAGFHPGGGSLALVRYLEEHGGVVYAELLRYYGVDITGLVSDNPGVTPAQVLALVENLPLGSGLLSVSEELDDASGWDTNSYLLASLIDAVRENTFANMQVRTKKRLQRPERVKVPGRREKPKPNNFMKMARAMFNQNLKEGEDG